MSKPEDVTQEAWEAAERPALRIALDYEAGQIWDVRPTIARAILAAEKRGEEHEREACAKLLEEGYDRLPGRSYRAAGTYSKNDTCAHDRYMWEDCEACAIAAIRARGTP